MLDYYFGFSAQEIRNVRTGASRYAFWVRSPHDPKRQTHGMRGKYGVDPHNKLNQMDQEELCVLIWRCLSAHPGHPMTFNALSVRLFDLTADVTGDTAFEDAVWLMLAQGCVAMTLAAPVLLLRTCDLTELTAPVPTFDPTPAQQTLW